MRLALCTDNGAMIAYAGALRMLGGAKKICPLKRDHDGR